MEQKEWRLAHGLGWVGCLTTSRPHTETPNMCFSKVSPSHKCTIHMVLKPNLDGNSIIHPFCLVHSVKVYSLRHVESYPQVLVPTVATILRIETFDSNVFHLLNLMKAFIIWFCIHFHLVLC